MPTDTGWRVAHLRGSMNLAENPSAHAPRALAHHQGSRNSDVLAFVSIGALLGLAYAIDIPNVSILPNRNVPHYRIAVAISVRDYFLSAPCRVIVAPVGDARTVRNNKYGGGQKH